MRFLAGVEKLALAVGGYRKQLPFVPACDVERAVRAESQVPDVFRLGIEENGLLARGGNLVDLAVG